jgi:hypothetical protein
MKGIRYLSTGIIALGMVVFILGGIFTVLAIQKNDFVTSSLRQQKLTLGLTKEQVSAGKLVDNVDSVMVAIVTLQDHLKRTAPTYGDLVASNKTGKFEPTDAANLSYAQGLNLITSLSLVALSFGVVQEILGTGIALLAVGAAVAGCGIAIFKLNRI